MSEGISENRQSLSQSEITLPSSLLDCPAFLWKGLLYPGRSPITSPIRWQSLFILLLLPGLFLYPCLSFRLFEPDEGRYAEIPREMLVRGDWVVPYLQGQPYLDKPPLLYWMVMVSFRFLGVHDWAARLVPAFAVHGCVLLTYGIGRRSLGERAGFWGALILGLAPGFTSVGRLLVLDGLLSFWVTLSILGAFEALKRERLRPGWWIISAIACGLGILTKGPVAAVLLVPPIWAFRRLQGVTCPVGRKAFVGFCVIVAAVVLPWYVAVCWRIPSFAQYFFWEQNVVRFVTPFDHQRPIWFYAPLLILGLLPVSLLAFPFCRFQLSGDPATSAKRPPEFGFMLLAGGWCVLFFSLSGCKLPTYILPGFPFLALALGHFVTEKSWDRTVWLRAAHIGAGAIMMAGHFIAIPWYAWYHSPMSRPDQVMDYCGNPETPVVCYPRNCDSVAFYLGRNDLRSFRSKQTPLLLEFLEKQRKTVVLFTHRHSLEGLRRVLPTGLRMVEEKPLSGSWTRRAMKAELCYMAVVEQMK